MKSIDFPTEVLIHLSYGQFYNIVDAVRNLVLNWSLELEKAGILGADMTFSAEEKLPSSADDTLGKSNKQNVMKTNRITLSIDEGQFTPMAPSIWARQPIGWPADHPLGRLAAAAPT